MPTTCAVVGCHNRQSKQCGYCFYRFPKEGDHRRRWIAFVSRRNPDGPAWKPGVGDRVCSENFISKKSDLSDSPDFVPSIIRRDLEASCSSTTYSHFERVNRRARIQEQRRKEYEKCKQATENEQLQLTHIRNTITHDHTYASKGEVEFLYEDQDGTRGEVYEEQVAELNAHWQEEPDEDSNDEQDESINQLDAHELQDTLGQNGKTQLQQASVNSILVEVGKAVISCFMYFCIPIECQTEMEWFTVEAKICELEKQLMERPEFSVETILEANDKLTRFYTGMPTYDSFLALVEYLELKALQLRAWRGTETNTNSNIEGTQQRGGSKLSMLYILVGSQSVICRVDSVATRTVVTGCMHKI